jgi:hypothetical protein
MSTAKLKRLKAAGWKAGSTGDFLQPSGEEAMLVELKLMLTDATRRELQRAFGAGKSWLRRGMCL